jgi:integrase
MFSLSKFGSISAACEVTVPWQSPDGRPRTFALVFTGDKGGPCNRAAFNSKIWVPARRRARIPDRAEDEGCAGMHQLRHHFALLLLRGGVDIKRVQEWLGRHSAAFTLDIYGISRPTITRRRCGRSRRSSRRPSARH